eukprot:gene12014-13120_t
MFAGATLASKGLITMWMLTDHASCDRIVRELPFGNANLNISGAVNSVWRKAHTRSDGTRYLYYSSEAHIVYFVTRFMEDILLALGLPLDFNPEVTIKQIRPNLCVLLLGMYLVGVVEIKKPGGNVLLEPAVLGELLDQMLLVEGFYGMGPVIGILTTGDEWVVSWFPVDQQMLEQFDSKAEAECLQHFQLCGHCQISEKGFHQVDCDP